MASQSDSASTSSATPLHHPPTDTDTNWALPDPPVGPGAHFSFPKNLKWAPWLIFFERPANA